ncbi:hypothetical protein CQ12_40055 [Bradyrhizobium jicamae]|uniref:Uncharacterized protein n=1 Tax=Bradyrhizobium jicamae TaxID=280332 RepID=A0A0R3KI43_9BRAD|nr:hypothetical protein [Bradyrhizobium jicamae]KRQ95331.1 hypothetical protein CQ12_40055 [Bradyrhizobium jicamae]
MDDGPTVFKHVCRMGLEGIVSKRTDVSQRAVEDVAQVEEPGERGGAPTEQEVKETDDRRYGCMVENL